MGVVLAGVKLHSICFLASTVHANGPEQVVCPVNKWLLGLASKYLVLFWLKKSYVPVQVCRAGDAALNEVYKDLVLAPLVYCVDVKFVT